ncbi:Peptidase [Bosea sp. 62]|uniref:A24 family peptidase n=1 Tax=unclassified Bosea (in: a-proteobacteria) TaxID=2653178 RepID=UPI00125235D9|nr:MULTISPECIES: prepilin peptidase [unclassified Bosea (in: a-proteobacteria)]CAD5284750.1 Peptidase [Bosea sp. 21B]CAD5287495.1 Peptidase [Bosea sp. 46]CAD5301628.1 Peptidase [Bosea sp. 7B]VVT51315.1 Peptidase [Bosea sp. EC-HK365B]VXB11821.1 Peptidase [Bosea sp. 62]
MWIVVMSLPLIVVLIVFPAAMAYAAASDLMTMTIPNWLCALLVVAFGVCAATIGFGLSAAIWHLAAGLLVLVVCFGMFAAGWIGGGDAKLAAATALWLGFEQLLPYLFVAALSGGMLTGVIMLLRAAPLPAMASNWAWAQRLHDVKQGVPYGIALAAAALVALPDTAIWRAATGV